MVCAATSLDFLAKFFQTEPLSSSQEELHLKALTEPYVKVSRHTALIVQVASVYGLKPYFQCSNMLG